MNELEIKFNQYNLNNPHVYNLFTKYANEVIGAGHERYSSKAIFERIRWHLSIETKGDKFKLNNNYTAYYARKYIQDNPSRRDLFETRERRSA